MIGEKYIIDTGLPTKEKTTETTVRNFFFAKSWNKPNQTIFKTEDLIYHLECHIIWVTFRSSLQSHLLWATLWSMLTFSISKSSSLGENSSDMWAIYSEKNRIQKYKPVYTLKLAFQIKLLLLSRWSKNLSSKKSEFTFSQIG